MIKMSKLPANMNTSAITNSVNQLTKQSNNQISALNKSNTVDNASVGSNPSASLNRNKNKSLQSHQLLQGGIQQRKIMKNQWMNANNFASNGSQ